MELNIDQYKILIENELTAFSTAVSWFDYSTVFVLVDENTEKHCLPQVHMHIPVKINLIIIPSGEQHKNLSTCQYIWKQLVEKGADRNSLMINLGGGVVGDMGGFCASTFMRGIRFIQMPTTLLSQVDASVGGKLGIDFMQYKNMVGTFNNPDAVFVYPGFLTTLDKRELTSGFAEVLKHAIVYDRNFWTTLSEINSVADEGMEWDKIIFQAVQIKQSVVELDPFEKAERKILNFGHSVGHAIESYFMESESPLTHGESIAIGMIAESFIAHKKDLLSKDSLDEITSVISRHFAKQSITDMERIIENTKADKKNLKGKKYISCPDQIGHCLFNIEVSDEEFRAGIKYYQELD